MHQTPRVLIKEVGPVADTSSAVLFTSGASDAACHWSGEKEQGICARTARKWGVLAQ